MQDQIYAAISQLLEKGKTKEARALFDDLPETETVDYWMLNGLLFLRFQKWGKAYNAFVKVQQLDPENNEAKTQIKIIEGILSFRNNDLFNP